MNTYSLVIAGLLVLIVGAFLLQSDAATTRTDAIKIGAVLSLTGNAATDGLSIKRGIDLAVDELQAKGVRVAVTYQDDRTIPNQTVSALQQMIATDKPDAIIGPTWSYLEDAAAPVIKDAKIVTFAPANTSEFVSVLSPYQFQAAPRNALKQEPMARWLKEHNKKRVAIMVDKTPWGASNAAPFRAAAAEAGAEVVVDETFPPFDANVGSTVATILAKAKAAHADVIMWTGYDSDGTALLQRRESLGFTVPVLAASSVLSSLYSRDVITKNQLVDVYEVGSPSSENFATKFEAKYGEKPGNYADRAYDSTMMLVEAIQNAKTKDGDGIAEYLRTNLTYTRDGQSYEFNENGDLKGGSWVIAPVVK